MAKLNEKELKCLFNKFDVNKTGNIDKAEIQRCLMKGGVDCDRAKKGAQDILKKGDLDGDSKISWAEFKIGYERTIKPQLQQLKK